MEPRKVTATFSEGTVLTRTSQSRIYTHAYLAKGTKPDPGPQYDEAWRAIRTWEKSGFSSSAEQAARNMDAETAFYRNNIGKGWTRDFAEVVAVEVVAKKIAGQDTPTGADRRQSAPTESDATL